mgnify:FL=1
MEQKIKIPQIHKDPKKALNFIMNEYFKAGFGALNKTDIDLIFFSVLEQFGNMGQQTDYQMSKKLGITQQRIRGFKERTYLKFGEQNKTNYNEKEVWAKLEEKLDQVTYDNKTEKITIPIYDVNLFMELEHIIEEKLHSVVGIQLNPKIFQITINEFFLLALMADDSVYNNKNDKKKIFAKIVSQMKKHDGFKKIINNENDIQNLGRNVIKTIGTNLLIDFVKDIIPGSNIALSVIKNVCEHIPILSKQE